MKRKVFKRITGFCLIIFTVLSLCSCGSTSRESNENAALAKEHVYSFQEVVMPDLGGDETDICASAYKDQTVSLLVKVTDWEDYNDNDMRLLSFTANGSGAEVSFLETIPWYPATEDGTGPLENSYYDNYTFGADGRVYAIRTFYKESRNPEEETETTSLRYLCCWKADGSLLWEAELEDFSSEEEYVFINAISVTEDGMASLIMTGEHAWKISVDAQGTLSDARQLSDETFQIFSNSAVILHQADGALLVICYGVDDWEEQYLIPYDPATDTLGEACRMPSSCGWDGYGAITANIGSGLLYSSRTGICSYAPGDTDGVEKMNFINSDLNISSFDALVSLDDTSFAGVFHEGYGSGTNMGVFTYVDPADVPDRSVLVLAGIYISDDVMQRVVMFNRNNDQYRIVVRNLKEYDSEEELAAGIVEMTNSVFWGNMPDILVTEGLPAETYAANGLLTNIGELIKEDNELSQIDFLQNVFDAYSMDGKLYYLIPSFEADTMIGASSTVGDRTSWSFADAMRLLETLPEGTDLIPKADRTSFLRTMMIYCGGSFISVGTGKCSFQSQVFLDMLKYAKSLPEELDIDSYGEDYWRNYETQYREGRTILASMPVSSFDDTPYYVNGIFGEDISYIGFPSESGAGSYIKAEESYAISSHSEYTEGAWEFLRYFLTDQYQSDLRTGLPVQRKYFLESSRAALGNPHAYDIGAESGTPTPLTEEQLERLINFILSTDQRYYTNENIINIVNEEAGTFFSGDKTAQETAKVIQSRVQLYLDENLN